MQRGLTSPSAQDLMAKYRVALPGVVEAIWNPLYHYQASVAAATASQLFFQTPLGQSGNTIEDTNMLQAGSLPKGQMFAVTGVQVEFFPNLDPYQPTALAGVAAVNEYVNDVHDFYKGGALILKIGSKNYIEQGNLMKFAPVNRLAVDSSLASTVAATTLITQYATAAGREFSVRDLVLESSMNFSVEIVNRNAVSTTGIIGVTLNGYLFRNAQ